MTLNDLAPVLESSASLDVPPDWDRARAADSVRRWLEEKAAAGGTLVQAPRAVALLRRDGWDSEVLGIEAGKVEQFHALDRPSADQVVEDALSAARAKGLSYLCCRVDSRDRITTYALQRKGFYLVDTLVRLEMKLPVKMEQPSLPVRFARPEDAADVARIAAESFAVPADTFNRYVNDPRIGIEGSRKVYERWARNSVEPSSVADGTLVAEVNGRVAGFVTVKANKEELTSLCPLGATAKEHRELGLLHNLSIESVHWAMKQGMKRHDAIVALQQVAIQRSWWKLGAIVRKAWTTWAVWLDGRPGTQNNPW